MFATAPSITTLFEATSTAGCAIDSISTTGISTIRTDEAAQVTLLTKIEASGMHSVDGHFSARVMMRHHGRLSGSKASQRHRTARALRELSEMAKAWRDGRIGTDQVRRVARTWSNPRIRHLT